jgi:hypothetical protein
MNESDDCVDKIIWKINSIISLWSITLLIVHYIYKQTYLSLNSVISID